MMSDFGFIINWWFLFFFLGLSFLPLATKIFTNFADSGYIFAKILGLAIISYLIWLLGTLHLSPFSQFSSWVILLLMIAVNLFIATKSRKEFFKNVRSRWKLMAFEEILFGTALVIWAYIRAHEPSIHGLEKFMDYGFINSILRAEFFPPKDLWLAPNTINYYYFGHLVTAVLTKLSGISLEITFNLMMATLFGLTFVGAFSIGINLFRLNSKHQALNSKQTQNTNSQIQNKESLKHLDFENLNLFRISDLGFRNLICGLLSAFLVTLGGNLHTLYAFIRGFDKYWYPDATRFIPYTIHEFPSYSWVVSDLHGHVLDIPFVLLTLALLLSLFTTSLKKYPIPYTLYPIPFILAVMYMTNAWDGLIYLLLTSLVVLYLWRQGSFAKYYKPASPAGGSWPFIGNYWYLLVLIGIIFLGFYLFALPFNLNFKPFVSGIGFVRDRSPLYMLAILWGFFYFFATSFLVFLWKTNSKHQTLNSKQAQNTKFQIQNKSNFDHLNFGHWNLFRISDLGFRNLAPTDVFVLLLILLSTLLLIFPEVAYVKDIYPLHYRANTMFKLGYQAFIMLSLASAYIFVRIVSSIRYQVLGIKEKILYTFYFILSTLLLIPIAIYPYFGIKSYYNGLRSYQGLNGLTWLKNQYPSDYQTIQWLRQNVKGQPVILEAVGESYTDYARVSVFTGLPTVVGWPVHEWLWRGSYDEAGKRDAEVKRAYETTNLEETRNFLKKYQVKYVFVGTLERQKYPQADFFKWGKLGKPVFQSGQTIIYEIP